MGHGVVPDCFLDSHGDGVTMSTWNELGNDPAAFHSYLDDLDQRLSKDGIAIPARAFHARLAIQRDLEMLLPLGSDLLAPVDAYFAAKYGPRTLIDPGVAREVAEADRSHQAERDAQGAGQGGRDPATWLRYEHRPDALLGSVTSLAKASLLMIGELAERLRVSKRAAYRLAREMIHVEIGGRLLVPEPAVDRYIETHTKEPTPWVASTSAATRTTRTLSTDTTGASSAPSTPSRSGSPRAPTRTASTRSWSCCAARSRAPRHAACSTA